MASGRASRPRRSRRSDHAGRFRAALNDIELFDLDADHHETHNLALDRRRHGELLLAMNDKMNALLEAEVGTPDDGRFLPGDDAQWAAARYDP